MRKARARVEDIGRSGQPEVTRNGKVVMRDGNRSVLLQKPKSKKTKACEYFEKIGGQMPGGGGFDPTQAPSRR